MKKQIKDILKKLERRILTQLFQNFNEDIFAVLSHQDFHYYPQYYNRIEELVDRDSLPDMQNIFVELSLDEFEEEIADLSSEYVNHQDMQEMIKKLKEQKIKRVIENSDDVFADLEKLQDENPSIEKALACNDLMDDYERIYFENKAKLDAGLSIGCTTGLKKIDRIVGFNKGNLVIISARPSMGKSAFAGTVAYGAMEHDHKILFCSLEMGVKDFNDRMLAMFTNESNTKYKFSDIDDVKDKIQLFRDSYSENYNSFYKRRASVSDIKKLVKKGNYDMVIIDYLQLMKKNDRISEPAAIGEITSKLQALAGETDTCIVLLSQIGRAGADSPKMEHLKGSGSIEEDADVVMIINREIGAGYTEITVSKNRTGRAGMTIGLDFDDNTTSFRESKDLNDINF